MVNIIKKELAIEEELKRKIDFICVFVILHRSLLMVVSETYIEPHRIIIKDISFLLFNYTNKIYKDNLNNKITINELEQYLKSV